MGLVNHSCFYHISRGPVQEFVHGWGLPARPVKS